MKRITGKKAIGFVRISDSRIMSVGRQVSEIKSFARANGYKLIGIHKEEESLNNKVLANRLGIAKLFKKAKEKKFKHILVTEPSRLARDRATGSKIVNRLCKLHINVVFINCTLGNNYSTLKNNKAQRTTPKLRTDFTYAQQEILILSQRVQSGMKRAKRRGVVLGRPKGKENKREFLAKYVRVRKDLKKNPKHSDYEISQKNGISPKTVKKVRLALSRKA